MQQIECGPRYHAFQLQFSRYLVDISQDASSSCRVSKVFALATAAYATELEVRNASVAFAIVPRVCLSALVAFPAVTFKMVREKRTLAETKVVVFGLPLVEARDYQERQPPAFHCFRYLRTREPGTVEYLKARYLIEHRVCGLGVEAVLDMFMCDACGP